MRFVIKKHFFLFLRFYGNSSLSVCMLLMWLVGRGRGLPPCRVVTLKKASVSISLFLQLMVADERGWKRNKTHETIYIKGGSSAFPTKKRDLQNAGRKSNANIYIWLPASFCQRTLRHFVSRPTNPCERLYLRSDPPWAGTPWGRRRACSENCELTVISLRLFGQFSLVHEVLSVCHGA